MAQESRVKKTLLNARVNLFFYFITLALSFFSRKIFLDNLGADFIGLTGSIGSLLGFLNLAELGIGAAIGYVLYKPIFDQDHQKINEIISVFGYLYRWVGMFILLGGLILAGFFPLIYPNTGFDYGIIYFAYFSFLFSSLIGYFVNYRQTLLGADQRNYVVTAYFQTAGLIKTLIQMALAYYTGSYYLWVVVEFVFGILYAIILNWKINQVYPWLKTDVRNGKELRKKYPEIIKYTKQLFVHKIGIVAIFQTTPFLIYAFSALQYVAYYGNYTTITNNLQNLLGSFLGSTEASVGNLIAEGDKNRILKVYWELVAIRFFVTTVFAFALYNLLPPFIELWLGKQYLMSETILLILIINFGMNIIRVVTDHYKNGFGIFYDVWAPFAEAIISLSVAIVCGMKWGLEGVLMGNIVSTIVIVFGWKPYILFKKGMQVSLWNYIGNFSRNIIVMCGCLYLSTIVKNILVPNMQGNESWLSWILFSVICVIIIGIVSLSVMLMFVPGMRAFISRINIVKLLRR